MKEKNKIERCKKLLSILSVQKEFITHERTSRYYLVLKILQNARQEKKEVIEVVSESNVNKCYFDLPELKVTSTTYERAKNRLEKQMQNRFKNR